MGREVWGGREEGRKGAWERGGVGERGRGRSVGREGGAGREGGCGGRRARKVMGVIGVEGVADRPVVYLCWVVYPWGGWCRDGRAQRRSWSNPIHPCTQTTSRGQSRQLRQQDTHKRLHRESAAVEQLGHGERAHGHGEWLTEVGRVCVAALCGSRERERRTHTCAHAHARTHEQPRKTHARGAIRRVVAGG